MQRIMVFGKPGGGKSTLAKAIAGELGITYSPLDLIEFKADGTPVSQDEFVELHRNLIAEPEWVIDGLGAIPTFWERVQAADTLVYIDLPYATHYWRVTKRLLLSPFQTPEGWPEGSSIWKGTMASWKTLRRSPRFWNDVFLNKLRSDANGKPLVHIQSRADARKFLVNLVPSSSIPS